MHSSTMAIGQKRLAERFSSMHGEVRSPELVPLLAMIAKRTRALVNIALGELDLVAGQDQMLFALDRERPIAVCELAEALSVRASTISKMLAIMGKKQLVAKAMHGDDARKVHFVLTDAGQDMRHRVEGTYDRLEAEMSRAVAEDRDLILAQLANVDRCLTVRLRRLR